MNVNIGTVACIKGCKPDKEQALKPLEEAAEVFGAWQLYDCTKDVDDVDTIKAECADLIQATCCLLDVLGVHDMRGAMADCRERNEARGREYEGEPQPKGVESDAFIKLPVDADGVPIKLGDVVTVSTKTGEERACGEVARLGCDADEYGVQWWARVDGVVYNVDNLRTFRHVKQKDSWNDLAYEMIGYISVGDHTVSATVSAEGADRAKKLVGVSE